MWNLEEFSFSSEENNFKDNNIKGTLNCQHWIGKTTLFFDTIQVKPSCNFNHISTQRKRKHVRNGI